MKKYKIICSFFLILFVLSFSGWSQIDSTEVIVGTENEVSIAYGRQEKQLVSSSVSNITGEELEKSSAITFGNTLFGRLPGLFVVQGGGEPGNDAPSLRIRGANASPLVIIDGFERNMTYLTPEEIESVSVLKDASAVALYGMKGANGAIVITTKRGANQKSKITFSVQSGVQTPVNTIEVLGAKNYMELYNQAALNDGLPAKYSPDDIAAAGTSPRYPDVNWKEEVVRKITNVSKANLGVLGGSDFIRYFVNFGFLYNNGIYKPSNPDMNANANMTRMYLRSNVDLNISKSTVFSMDLAGSIDNKGNPAFSVDEIWDAIYTLPPNAFNVRNPDNSYGGTSLLMNNPVAMLETSGANNSVDHFLNAGFRLRQNFDFLAKGLSASIGYVIDNGANNSDGNWRFFQVRQIAPGSGDDYEYYTYRENAQYNTWSNASSRRFRIFDADLRYDMPETNGNELNFLVRFQSDSEWRQNSDLSPYLTNNVGGRLSYVRNKKYILELSASYYGSDQYAEGNRYGLFPSASAGWVFSNEGFMKSSESLTFGKLKASYGIAGLNPYRSGRYPYTHFYEGGGSFPLGTDWTMFYGLQPGRLANPDIKWEEAEKINVGLELEWFDRLSFATDFYIDKRSDVLYIDYSRFSVTGATLPYENIGRMTNKGFDASLGYASDNASGSFNWYTDVVFSFFDNTIDEMGESVNSGNLAHLNRTGNPLGAIYGYEVVGYFEGTEDIASSPTQMFGEVKEGDLKYRDLSGDGIIDERDMTMIGNQTANIDLGLKAGFSWKNFDFETLFQGQLNRDIVLAGNALYEPFISGNAATEIVLEDGFPTLSLTRMNNYQNSSYWMRNTDFVKLRSLELGYSFPGNRIERLGMDRLRFFFRGMNMLTLSKWKYTDPEFSSVGYPPMKAYYLGVNINF